MKLTITTADNGYILEYPNELLTTSDDVHTDCEVFVIENDNSAKAIQHLLYSIIDVLDVSGSRYDKERVYVEVRPGDKYEELTKEGK
jgi:hypothetical protein